MPLIVHFEMLSFMLCEFHLNTLFFFNAPPPKKDTSVRKGCWRWDMGVGVSLLEEGGVRLNSREVCRCQVEGSLADW